MTAPSANVYDTKVATGRGAADNIIFCLDYGAIIAPDTADDNIGLVLKNTLLRRIIQLGVDLDLDIYPW